MTVEETHAVFAANRGLVYHVLSTRFGWFHANALPGRSLAHEDLVSAGHLGLLRAIDTYDPTNAAAFGTYAARVIWSYVIRLIDRGADRNFGNYRRATGAPPRVEVTAVFHEVGAGYGAGARTRELHAAAELAELEAAAVRAGAVPPAPPDARVERASVRRLLRRAVREALPPRERKVIHLRYWRGFTYDQVGRAFGFSRQRAQQVEARALRALRERLGADGVLAAGRPPRYGHG